MDEREQKAILTLSLMAAFADGGKTEAERAEVRRIAGSLSEGTGLNLSAVVQDVLLRRATPESAVAALGSAELRQLAYEMAVCVCDADGAQNEAERAFLESLRAQLGLETGPARAFSAQAEALASAPLAATTPAEPEEAPSMFPEQMDAMILNYAILNGALELLPDSLATMAIIPLQMKMVYRVGKAHGYELDRGHIKDFLATAGVGLTSQYLEEIGTKLIGGLLRKVGGKMLAGIGRQATSSAFSFATTYALGHVARRYYAGGRKLSATDLRQAFDAMLGQARGLQQRYADDIAAKARTLDVSQVLAAVRQ